MNDDEAMIMEFRPIKCDDINLIQYSNLFRLCFPNVSKFSLNYLQMYLGFLNVSKFYLNYLQWLYRDNPDGIVMGFDAYDNEKLVAHYACVPSPVLLHGRKSKSLLSLNTATHPDYQRKGLFATLASMTYEHATKLQFDFVYGIANASSTSGLVNKLGFQLVAPLEARIGIGRLPIEDNEAVLHRAAFQKFWDLPGMTWRLGNPTNRVYVTKFADGTVGLHAATGIPFLRAYTECFLDFPVTVSRSISIIAPRLFIGLLPGTSFKYTTYQSIPKCVRPSPLNLIYLNLQNSGAMIEAHSVFFSFLDFDAY